ATLPTLSVLLALAAIAGLLCAVRLRLGAQRNPWVTGANRFLVPALIAVLAGFVWAAGFGSVRLAQNLAPENEGRDIEITGVVAVLPQQLARGERFVFEVERSTVPVP